MKTPEEIQAEYQAINKEIVALEKQLVQKVTQMVLVAREEPPNPGSIVNRLSGYYNSLVDQTLVELGREVEKRWPMIPTIPDPISEPDPNLN